MYQFIYNQAAKKNKLRWHFFNRIRMQIARYWDPAIRYVLYEREVSLPFSHPLPILLKIHPLYSTNLTRLAAFLRTRLDHLIMVDVGANIGDSYLSTNPCPGDSYLLVDGEPHFYEFLVANTRSDPFVKREFALLMEEESGQEGRFVVQAGNATLRSRARDSVESPARCTTLDRLIVLHPSFRRTNLLKVDVEGYDRRVLAGGRKFLAKTKPVIFFEHHPGKIDALDEDHLQVFQDLAGLGYGECLFYDNLGFFMGASSITRLNRIADLVRDAEARKIYLDVGCFHKDHRSMAKVFLQHERVFYKQLSAKRFTDDET